MNIFNSYLLFTIFVVLLSLFFSMNITYKKYFLAKAVVNNNGYLKCLVEENSLSLLNKNSTLIIDEVEYQYSISSVEPIEDKNVVRSCSILESSFAILSIFSIQASICG